MAGRAGRFAGSRSNGKRRSVAAVLFIGIVCFMMSGCAARKGLDSRDAGLAAEPSAKQSAGDGAGKDWKVQYQTLKLQDGETLKNIVGVQERVFAVRTLPDTMGAGQKLVVLEMGKMEEADISLPEDCRIDLLFTDGKALLYVLGTDDTEGGNFHFLLSADIADGTQKLRDITAAWEETWDGEAAVLFGAADGGGHICLGDFGLTRKILVMDGNGQKAAEIDLKDMELQDMAGTDGKVYLAGSIRGQDTLFQIEEQGWAVEEAAALPESRGTALLQPGGDGILLYGYQDALYRYDARTGEGADIFEWACAGLEGRHVLDFSADGTGNILVFPKKAGNGKDMTMILLKPPAQKGDAAAKEEKTNRETVAICGDAQDSELAKAVGRFNATNEQYRVEIREYDYDRLLTEIMTGKGPDLIPIGGRLDLDECVKKGVVEDLEPYLERSGILSRDMLNSKVLEMYTADGILACIPPSFSIISLYGRASELGNETGWTLEEFLEYVDSHRGLTVMEGIMAEDSREVIMQMLWRVRRNTWIDWEQRTAHFDQGEFEELLRFAASYESKYDLKGEGGNTEERLREGKILLYSRPVNNMEMYLWYRELMGGDMAAIGYPTLEGTPCNEISGCGEYAINAKSEHKDGAWAFLEYLAAAQTAEESYSFGIPTLNSEMEAMLEESMEEKKRSISGIEIPPATASDVEEFRELIENAAIRGGGSYGIASILTQELSSCFYDGRSVEETVQVIQNRVQLYLDE